MELVCEVTSGRKMAGRHLRNRSITFVEGNIGGRDSNKVDEISSLNNTAIYQEAEKEGIVMAECEGNNSNSIITNEVSVGMSTRQLQDLLTNAFFTLRSDIVTKFQVECSNLRADFLLLLNG